MAISDALIRKIGRAAGEAKIGRISARVEATTGSEHFQGPVGRTRRKWAKFSTIVLCGRLLPLSLVLGSRSSNDQSRANELIARANLATLPAKLSAVAGYAAERAHDPCQLDWGAEMVIKPAKQQADGRRSGVRRSRMSESYLKQRGSGTRRGVESFFSGLKRRWV